MSPKLKPCTHGGNNSCKKQGGSGSLRHAVGYMHPYPTLAEAGSPIGDFVEPVSKAEPRTVDFDLGTFFDDELAETDKFNPARSSLSGQANLETVKLPVFPPRIGFAEDAGEKPLQTAQQGLEGLRVPL